MADSEVRQKFEALLREYAAKVRGRILMNTEPNACAESEARDALLASWQASMRAGEIARWIPVEEKLPPRHQDVLCYNRDGEIFQGRICVGMHKPFFTYPRGFGDPSNTAPDWINVTHWQPRPAAPEEKVK